MKKILVAFALMLTVGGLSAQTKVLYDFNATSLDGQSFNLSSLKGKKVMVVNTASKCGLTPQYASLQKLYEKYKDKNFVIVGFPANNLLLRNLAATRRSVSSALKIMALPSQ